jgi:hypothetical protein
MQRHGNGKEDGSKTSQTNSKNSRSEPDKFRYVCKYICWNEYILRTLIEVDWIFIKPKVNIIFYVGAVDHRSAFHQEACGYSSNQPWE